MTQVYKEGLRGEAGVVLPQAGESSGSELALIIHAPTMLSLVIPTYNEQENIESLLIRTYKVLEETGLLFEIIIVDDDSPDGTWKVAQALSSEYPGVRVIRRIAERSLARAVVRGWEEARGEILAVMDGDLQHPPETLVALIKALDGADIAVASRHLEGGGVSQWSILRGKAEREPSLLKRRNKISDRPLLLILRLYHKKLGGEAKRVTTCPFCSQRRELRWQPGLSREEGSNAVFALLALDEASYEDPLAARDRRSGYP